MRYNGAYANKDCLEEAQQQFTVLAWTGSQSVRLEGIEISLGRIYSLSESKAIVQQWPLLEARMMRQHHCRRSLHSNVDLVVRQSPVSKEMNTEAEEATSLEAGRSRLRNLSECCREF
jgi:hypothetical protein